ncbi:class I SAM-dependent RNA methyltransferase [bacterium]|nr:class I SAM-dependent RNA methyltransferase [bacterium]
MHNATIKSLAYGGYGVTHIDSRVCFVPYAVPQDELIVEITSEKKSVTFGRIVEIEKPSPFRKESGCPLFEQCGGCHWLNIDYDEQLKWKLDIVQNALKRIGGIDDPPVKSVTDGITSLAYRTRARFHFTNSPEFVFGFHAPRSREIIDMQNCPLLHDGINDLIPEIKQVLQNIEPLKYNASIELIQNPTTLETLCWLELSGEDTKRCYEIASSLLEINKIDSVDWKDNPADKTAFSIALPDVQAWVPTGSFSQSSFLNNDVLLKTVIESAGEIKNKRVWDIYCGWGNLSLPLAANGAIVTGYDSDANAIETANMSVSDNEIKTARYEKSNDSKLAGRLTKPGNPVDIIMLDPTRTGAKALADAIAKSPAQRIIYISCDPNTLARDLKTMVQSGRKLIKTHVIDMIPNTYHIETVNLIE